MIPEILQVLHVYEKQMTDNFLTIDIHNFVYKVLEDI